MSRKTKAGCANSRPHQIAQLKNPSSDSRKFAAATKGQQHARTILLLRTGRKSTMDLRRSGIIAPAARILELKELGYDIPTIERITLWDDAGIPHPRVAVYELVREPKRGGVL